MIYKIITFAPRNANGKRVVYTGWYLFKWIPLYVRQETMPE